MEKEKHLRYVAGRLYLSNSCADRVACILNGASFLRAWEEMLNSVNFASDLHTLANYDVTLAKLVIGSNSSKLPQVVEKQLIEEARKYPLNNKDYLIKESDREEAISYKNKLKHANTIEKVIGSLNNLLYFERDGLALKIGLPPNLNNFEKQFVEETKQEVGLNKRYLRDLVEDCYKFLSEFDPELAIKLRASDDFMTNAPAIYDEGIQDLTHSAL